MIHCAIAAGALVLSMLVGQDLVPSNKQVPKTIIEGKVKTASSTNLTMTDKSGELHSHLIGADAKLTLDGKPAKMEQLVVGTKIRATIIGAEKRVSTIEAIIKNRNFASSRIKGELINFGMNRLIMRTDDGKTLEKKSVAETRLILDGKECMADDLSPATRIRVTIQGSDPDTVTVIEGIFNNKDFLPDCYNGKIVSIDGTSLVLIGDNGMDPHTCIISPDAKVTYGGAPKKFTDLKLGMKIRLTSHPDDENTIIQIEQIDPK